MDKKQKIIDILYSKLIPCYGGLEHDRPDIEGHDAAAEEIVKLFALHGVVSSKTIHSKLANKHETLKGELNTITNIINGNKGMSSDYILDKTRNIPFLRCKLNLIEEMLGN